MSQDSKPTGVAIIGCGYWGVNYIRIFDELAQSRLVAICDFQEERLREIGARYPDVALTTRIDDVLAREDVAAVIVATPARSHYEVTRRCLLAGKHVLVEKPLSIAVSEGEDLIALAESRGLILMVGHTFLYNSSVQKVKEYVDKESTGQIYYLYSRRTNMGPIRRDVNALWDLAPHDISIFNYLLGRQPLWVSAVGANVLQNSRADVGFITLGYGEELVGNIHVSWSDPDKVRELVVVGSNRRIVFNDMSPQESVKIYEKGVTAQHDSTDHGMLQFDLHNGDIISPHVQKSEPLKNQCRHFMESVATGRRVMTDGHSGLDVVRVMEAIDRSVAAKGVPVPLITAQGPNPTDHVPRAARAVRKNGRLTTAGHI